VDYQYDKVLDIENINNCIGKKVVITYEEFAETRKVSIDQFICYVASPPCYMDEDHIKKLKDKLGISMGRSRLLGQRTRN
jgi:peptide-O-fucosyltransferase